MDFNIGTYFVPEGTGHIIEQAADIPVVVKISSGGDAIIKQMLPGEAPFNPNVAAAETTELPSSLRCQTA